MRPALPLLLLGVLSLTGCGGGGEEPAPERAAAYSEDVRRNFLDSCVENATRTSDGKATPEQLQQTCDCILGKVEQEYGEDEFAAFEQRLLGGTASEQESGRLVGWSTDCAQQAAG